MTRQIPEIARQARRLAATMRVGVLSTLSTDGGYPYGSLLNYSLLSGGDPVIETIARAEHSRYLSANPHCSLLIATDLQTEHALASLRVALLGRAERQAGGDGTERWQIDVQAIRVIHENAVSWLDLLDWRAADGN